MSKVWLVTGSNRGLGRDIAQAVLARGDRLFATARDPAQLADLVERYGERVRAFALDVVDAHAAHRAAREAVDAFGRVDVLVNNAGYGRMAPFEQTGEDEFRDQIETNLFGVVNLSRAVLPIMRAQRSGHIIQISSVGGRIGTPGLSAYQAAKWAVGGFSEVLAAETAGFGVKVCALEPGGMRTGWGVEAMADLPQMLPEYEQAFGPMVELFRGLLKGDEANPGISVGASGDPARVAQVVLGIADHPQPPLHLLLGSDALQYASNVETARADAGERWRAVSQSTDAAASGPIPAFPAL
jgi:NAD(P)-dependent dehydrogenase (short-subunit alcohol dehydrogenase family)